MPGSVASGTHCMFNSIAVAVLWISWVMQRTSGYYGSFRSEIHKNKSQWVTLASIFETGCFLQWDESNEWKEDIIIFERSLHNPVITPNSFLCVNLAIDISRIQFWIQSDLRDFRLPPWSIWGLRSSGLLRSE